LVDPLPLWLIFLLVVLGLFVGANLCPAVVRKFA
jgi:hypothetical protein